jgi:hypothetical protein
MHARKSGTRHRIAAGPWASVLLSYAKCGGGGRLPVSTVAILGSDAVGAEHIERWIQCKQSTGDRPSQKYTVGEDVQDVRPEDASDVLTQPQKDSTPSICPPTQYLWFAAIRLWQRRISLDPDGWGSAK